LASEERAVAGLTPQVRYTDAVRTLAKLVGVAFAYWVAAHLSLGLALVHGQVTPVWPPTGIAVVALLVFGRRVWPAIFIAALAVNLPLGPTPLGAAIIATGNTLAPLFATELLKLVDFHRAVDRLRDAAAMIVLAGLVGMSVSATLGTSVLVLSGAVSSDNFWSTWAVWWTGDAMGVLLVAPFLLSLMPSLDAPPLNLRSGAELVLLLVGIGLVTYVLFEDRLRLEYLVFPLIMVAAWRFRLRGAAPAALIASGIAIWTTVQGTGPFADESLLSKMVSLQVFNVCVALTSFVLASFVTAYKRQEQMSLMYAAANAASEAKGAFLNVAAHELRTPITVLNGYLSMLADGSLGQAPEQWEKPLGVLMAKTFELDKIVEDLLDASRIDANRMVLEREVVDLRGIVDDAVERARPRAALIEATLSESLGSDLVLVDADERRIGRVLDNLINNGMSYSHRPAHVTVEVSAQGGKGVVKVKDVGIGIPADHAEAVFERFYRRAGRGPDEVPGVGLGLYISRQVAQQHGGDLVVASSAPGEGSIFALTLPLVPES
jgi:signal transduction histidine kinase